MAIKISACLITKNEEKNMPNWLKCMKAVADEIIVVDTGSTDNTVKLAQEAGAQLYNFKWINDFAAAKNYAIDQATGDWIIFLDADDVFTEATQKILRQELERFHKDKNVACLLCRTLEVDADNDYRVFNTSIMPRVFRRSPYIRYKGAIHEQLENAQGNKKMVFAEKLETIHTGYSRSIIKSKSERNLPILLSELEKATTDEERQRIYPYLVDAYNILGDYDKMMFYARECISIGVKLIGEPEHFYEVITMAMYNAGRPLEELLSTLDEAEAAFPEEAFFWFVRGMALEKAENYIAAEKAVLRGLELRKPVEEKLRQGIGIADTSRGLLPYAYERLGNIYSLKGDKKKAADNYFMALMKHKYQKDSLQGLCRTLAGSGDVEFIELLNSLYDREQDGPFIIQTLNGLASVGVLYYYGKGINGFEQGYIYMAGGRYDSAEVKFGEQYRTLIQAAMVATKNMKEYPNDGYLNILVSGEYLKGFENHTKEAEALRRLTEYRERMGLDL